MRQLLHTTGQTTDNYVEAVDVVDNAGLSARVAIINSDLKETIHFQVVIHDSEGVQETSTDNVLLPGESAVNDETGWQLLVFKRAGVVTRIRVFVKNGTGQNSQWKVTVSRE